MPPASQTGIGSVAGIIPDAGRNSQRPKSISLSRSTVRVAATIMAVVAIVLILLEAATLVRDGANIAGFGFVASGWGVGGLALVLVLLVRAKRRYLSREDHNG